VRPAPKRGSLATALWMLRAGLWPVACYPHEKRPIGRAWAATRTGREKLVAVFERHRDAGVGIALGPAAGVVDFEIDAPTEAAGLLERLELPPSLGWRSARGEHRLFLWDGRLEGLSCPAVAHLGGAELRIGGAGKQLVCVCPPSVGDDGRCRRWNGVWQVAPLPEVPVHTLGLREFGDGDTTSP
jgi:bifunctional DNA primase/polymerase-like protein